MSGCDDFAPYPRDPSQYQLRERVGSGGSSNVYRARCKAVGDEDLAVKMIDLERSGASIEQFTQEANLLRRACHPNVLHMKNSFVDGSVLWLVMPYHPHGSIKDVIATTWPQGIPDEVFVVAVLQQLLEGLAYIHGLDAYHRDIKAANLLVSAEGEVCVSDFGIAIMRNREEHTHSSDKPSPACDNPAAGAPPAATSERRSRSPAEGVKGGVDGKEAGAPQKASGEGHEVFSCREDHLQRPLAGTPCWMAPETVRAGEHTETSDVWSVGITAIELAVGHPPYHEEPTLRVWTHIVNNDPPTLASVSGAKPPAFSPEFSQFLARCLRKNPRQRPAAQQLLADALFDKHREAVGASPQAYVKKKLAEHNVPLANARARPTLTYAPQRSATLRSWADVGSDASGEEDVRVRVGAGGGN
ncbi:hypothetical protein DIPPA_58834, partial [Diplonema papillatum]